MLISQKFRKIQGKTPVPIKKDTPTQVFSYEFCEIFKNTFFTEHHRITASVYYESVILFLKKQDVTQKFWEDDVL